MTGDKATFRRLNYLKRRKLSIEELIRYNTEYRKQRYRNGEALSGIAFRRGIHLLVRGILKIDQLCSKEKITVIGDKRKADDGKPKIYACTHVGGNDIQRAFQVIGRSAWLMLGDPGILYRMLIYQGLKLNGVIPLETTDREDRKIAYQKSTELLRKGGNLLIYPEGAWNVTPNLVVMKTFTGTVRLAMETGVEIIPIAMEQYGKTFYINIGENYSVSNEPDANIDFLNSDLRNKLATLKWEIMERQPAGKRESVPTDYLHTFQTEIVNRCNYGYGFSLEDAIKESFHDKSIILTNDVFAHLGGLLPCPENAFLFNKRIKGDI